MAEIKKYDYLRGVFRKYASSHARGIATQVQKLLNEGEQEISVEEGLSRMSDKIDTLFGNVAWLAKNGGGGSGGGGGSDITEATGTLVVNGVETGNPAIMGVDGLIIELNDTSIELTKSWIVTVQIGANEIARGSLSYVSNILTVSPDKVSRYLTNHQGNLIVTATYADDNKGIYGNVRWSGTVIESVVNVYMQDGSTSLSTLDTSSLSMQYSVGYLGDTSVNNYRLSIKVSKDNILLKTYTEDLRILETSVTQKNIPLRNLIEAEGLDAVGVYRFEATLTSINNASITGSNACNFTVASTEILISSSTMSSDEESPQRISMTGSLVVDFTAYVERLTTYTYFIRINNTEVSPAGGLSGRFGERQNVTLSVSGKPWAVEDQTAPVEITVISGDKTATKTFYVMFAESADSFLDMRQSAKTHMLYQMRALDFNTGDASFPYSGSDYVRGGSVYNIGATAIPINQNNLSVIRVTDSGMPYLRLSNGASLKLGDWTLDNGGTPVHYDFTDFFSNDPNAINEFTISICFKADYHADDYRTILFCGNLDVTTEEISTGISIDAHNIYINNESVYELSDNTVNMVDITCTRTTSRQQNPYGEWVDVTTYIIKVYVDGVITATRAITTGFLNLGDSIYLGCRNYKLNGEDVYTYLCDCDIYSLQIYDRALTDYDIMINRANNLAITSFVNNSPQYTLIDRELKRNFCERNAEGELISHLYNPDTNTYSVDFLMGTEGGVTVLNEQNLQDYASALGIPIVFIDVSTDPNWTFNAFSAQQTAGSVSLPATQNRRIQYWDPNGDNTQVITLLGMTIDLQGTSTLADFVKNLNITAPDDTVFIPKSTWLFENTYTLKADVVDSSHSCNAALGKFINEKLGYDPASGNSYLPIPQAAINNVYNTDFHRDQQPTATIKHTVEGFPVLLIMKFYVTQDSTVSITPLGIYSFNLGRNAYHNLGFKKINSIQVAGETPSISVFPFAIEHAVIDEEDGNANWIEIKDTTSVADLVNVKDSLPADFDCSHGDFWQDDDNILNTRYEVRYPAGRTPASYNKFKTFVHNIMWLPFEGCYSTNSLGQVTKPQIGGTYALYTCDVDGTNYRETGQDFTMSSDPNDFSVDTLGFNYESFIKYITVACMHGLADNMGKNMTFRSWLGGDYYAGFYDLDCCYGQGNQGLLDISYDMWLKYLRNVQDGTNVYGYVGETFNNEEALSNTVFSANHNKIWLSIDTAFFRRVVNSDVASLFTQEWYNLRSLMQTLAGNAGYKTIWDYFVNEYFIPQTGDCGSLMFNYDYKLKYFLQFTDDSYNDTKAITKLHGRKISYTRTWLKRRITFLDTLYHWRDNTQPMTGFLHDVNSRGANSVYSTPDAFPFKSNTSLIMYHSVGDQTKTFYFMKQNVKTWVNTARSASDSILNWNFSNSPNIIELGDDDVKLKDMNVANLSYQTDNLNIDYTGYPSLTLLDFSQNRKFNGFTLGAFKPIAREGEIYDRKPISELREIDFSNTSGASFNLDLTYLAGGKVETWFTKLYRIDISGSTCISNLSIPEVPLLELDVAGSSILNFTLKNQAYLPQVDLTGCSRLQEITIDNCSGYEEFSIENLSNLTSCSVLECKNIEHITINACSSLRSVNIEKCSKLKSVTITNCPSLVGTVLAPVITIQDCPLLESISFSGCTNLVSARLSQVNQSAITSLNFSGTRITGISGDNANTSLLDLSAFVGLENFTIANNGYVTNIQFNNGALPIHLGNAFTSCVRLERIFGYVAIGAAGLFNGCSRFSIHGTDLSTVQYFGTSVLQNGVVRLPRRIAAVEQNQQGLGVTNMIVAANTTSLASTFKGTACTAFDIYYILERASHVTNMNSAFYNLVTPAFSWTPSADNSPNKNMFELCTSVTDVSYMCRQNSGSNKLIRLFSPTMVLNENDEIVSGQNDGLFSYIAGTVTALSGVFYGYTYVCDRKVFRHTNTGFSNVRTFTYFNPKLIVNNVNNLNLADITLSDGTMTETKWRTYVANNYSTAGNINKMFVNFTNANLTTLYSILSSTMFLNYEKVSDLPGTKFQYSFTSQYASGTIISLAALFRNPASVTELIESFRVSARLNALKLTLSMSDNLLTGMTALQFIGYADSTLGSWSPAHTDPSYSSLAGYGINKVIHGTFFPYAIFTPCPNLRMASCFFDSCEAARLSTPPALPGTLFQNATQIRNVAHLFHNVFFEYTLSSRGFANCPNLTNVRRMFAATESYTGNDTTSSSASSSARKNYGTGSIPRELFYHGETAAGQNSYTGVDGEVTAEELIDDQNIHYTKYTIVIDEVTYYCTVKGTVVTWYDEDEEVIPASDVLVTPTYPSYRNVCANITNMEECFGRGNFDYYRKEGLTDEQSVEGNVDYQPLTYIFENRAFKGVTKNTDFYTEQWTYDGNTDNSVQTFDGETVQNLDDENDDVAVPITDVSSTQTAKAGTLQYMCAPDLLRYCKKGCVVSSLFKDGGHNLPSPSYGNAFSANGYGMEGRIVPYLLLPLRQTLASDKAISLDYMFYNCKLLSAYQYSQRCYMIPRNFFRYCPKISSMQYAFAGMTFNWDVQLKVFDDLDSISLTNISHIFYTCYYAGTTQAHPVTLSGIFETLKSLTQADYAFAATYNADNTTPKQVAPYIVFNSVFPSNRKYAGQNYNNDMKFSYIFAYYKVSTGNITHEAVKTVVDNTTTNNYKEYTG